MDLKTYLEEKDETVARFSRRSGVLADTIINIRDGVTRCRIDIAQAIVRASREEPTRDGGDIAYDDLVPASKDEQRSPSARPHTG